MQPPFLLHRASYDTYSTATWYADNAPFSRVSGGAGAGTWVLNRASGALSRITISERVEHNKAVLSLPNGTVRIERLPAGEMNHNALGAFEIEQQGNLAIYDALFDARMPSRDAPRAADLKVPAREAAALSQVADELQLARRSPHDRLAAVDDFFRRNFTYTTYLADSSREATPLAGFLLKTRAGHCEYFATATVLLLRTAGIPARYATGFSVQEWRPLEHGYVARLRHAHAWVRAYIDGEWIDFDTTPPAWVVADAAGASLFQPLGDLWASLSYRYSRWQREDENASIITAAVLVVPLVIILIWRVLSRNPLAAGRAAAATRSVTRGRRGLDSEFYQIEKVLARRGYARAAHEPLSAWLARLARERSDIAIAPLIELLRLHYRLRFDPHGLTDDERALLRTRVREWMRQHAESRS
jgi:protein-glutamine gamma-glutamyltransferase